MRDAFGGAFSIKLMLIFIVLYISFICVAINYARAFRVKNRIINIVEQYEGYNGANQSTVDRLINNYLLDTGYHVGYDEIKNVSSCSPSFSGFATGRGYCIFQREDDPTYYGIETYMVFTIPVLNVHFPIVIRGETRRIEILK